jgi:hypothetical protein
MFRLIHSITLAAGLIGLSLAGLISLVGAEPIDPARLIDPAKMKPQGSWQEVTWPATLDLAERAELSLNELTRATDAASDSVYASFDFGQSPPALGTASWFLNPRNLHVLPYLRTICGKDDGLDAEAKMMKKMLLQIDPVGLVTSPDDTGWPKGTSVPLYNGQLALAMLTWHERDKNPAWLDGVGLISSGLGWTSIDLDDRAFYPLECSFKRVPGPPGLGAVPPSGTWHPTTLGKSLLPYTPPAEPENDQQGYEGCAKYMTVSGPIEALVGQNRYKRDAMALDRAMRLARFSLKPGMWQPSNSLAYPGNEHGVFAGQLTGNVHFLRALLELGIAKRSAYLKQFAREGYMYTTRNGIARMGWYPAWVMPEKFQRPKDLHGISDNGGVAAMLMLAVKLSDAGMDDYWDNVDAIVRNQLIEQQFTDLSAMRQMAGGDPKNDALLARFFGGCGVGEPTAIKPEISATASLSTAAAFYYAWHGITRFDHGLAQVNLFLNRASRWMDVESYLPFEGKVILRNKQAEAVRVRIPAWVDVKNLKVLLNGQPIEVIQPGRCVMVEGIKNGDVIELNFIVRERTDKYFIHDKTYTIQFRGSTVVDISPRNTDPRLIPMYQRDAMKGTKAPMHTVKRFVAENLLPLQ